MERRLAAILAADVVGYTRLMGDDEAGTLAALKAHRAEHFDPTVAAHRGRVVKLMGDGALVEFPSAVDAVTCAVAIQRGMTERNAEVARGSRILFRIGINIGDVIVEGEDIYGDGVNVAARIEGLAEPGGVCLSDDAYRQVKGKTDAGFEDLGEQEVKNVTDPIRVYRVAPAVPGGNATSGGDAAPSVSEELALPDKPSIAVLPFDNMTNDPEQDYLADGISEDLITALSKIRWFFVIARNSTFTYKGRAVEVRQVARELGVRYVLEGSVRKAGARVRVTAQLIDATTGRHVWAERYDRQIEDIFDLQDEMTRTIVGAVEPELSAAERDRALSRPPENLDAWACYQRGLWHMWRGRKDDNLAARRLFRQARDLDPNFAASYAYEAYTHYTRVIMGWTEDREGSLSAGMAAAKAALALDDRDPTAYFAMGRVLMLRGAHDDSIAALERSIALNPSFAQAYHGLGMAFTLAGRLAEAKEALSQAERFSPRDPILWSSTVVHALACILSEDYEEGRDWAETTLRNPRSRGYWPHATLAAALAKLGRLEEARTAVAAALEAMPDLSLAYLEENLPTKAPGGLAPYLEGLRAAGLPEGPE
jgi:adenylate cyclase